MRKFKFINHFFSMLVIVGILMSCKNNRQAENVVETTEQNATGEIYSGELTFTSKAAVFVGSTFIYGVEMNDKAKELAERVEAIKSDIHDIVPVTVRGKVIPKSEEQEGWDEILTITEIIDISDTAKQPDVRIK